MDKMRMESIDITQNNIEKIEAIFPNVITESRDGKGGVRKAINFELLKQMLSDDVVEGDEAYEFTWVGKKAAIAEANRPIRKTLRPCVEESVDWDNTENLYIEGDNLEVLKLLQESYLGAVKMIYIDPPYNTGKDFVYPDSFMMDNEIYSEGVGYFDEDGNVNFKRENNHSIGRYHSDWCSMMYSRMLLASKLLTSDGIIFISIDDNEVENLTKICNEIFGEVNKLAVISWKRKKEISNDSNNVAIQGEYILVYAKGEQSQLSLEPISQEYLQRSYNEPTEEFPLGRWRPVPLTVSKGLTGGGYTYTITTPSGVKHTRLWAYPEKSYERLLREKRVYFGKNNNGIPQRVMYASESKGQPVTNYWDNTSSNKEGKKEIIELFGDNYFDTPKPTNLLARMIRIATNSNDIVMDFFSGSSSTGHAVMKQNIEDGGKRRFIMVQVEEPCPEKSIAKNGGYINICEIGKERLRRAAKKLANEESDIEFDKGFRVLKLADSNMKDVYYSASEYNQANLDNMISNIKEDRTDLDLLFSCVLEWGLPLSLPYTSEEIEGYKVHTYNEGDLIACFESGVPESVIKTIAKRHPLRVVFRDSSFVSSPAKINVSEIFKLLSPSTSIKVI